MTTILDLRPARLDIMIAQGDTVPPIFAFSDKESGNPIDLTDATPRLRVRAKRDDAASLSEFTAGNGLTVDDEAGTIAWIWPYADTENRISRTYWYDLELTWVGGLRRTYLHGMLTLTGDVSHAN